MDAFKHARIAHLDLVPDFDALVAQELQIRSRAWRARARTLAQVCMHTVLIESAVVQSLFARARSRVTRNWTISDSDIMAVHK